MGFQRTTFLLDIQIALLRFLETASKPVRPLNISFFFFHRKYNIILRFCDNKYDALGRQIWNLQIL